MAASAVLLQGELADLLRGLDDPLEGQRRALAIERSGITLFNCLSSQRQFSDEPVRTTGADFRSVAN